MSERLPKMRTQGAGPEALLVGVIAFAVYVLLRQEALHGTDWRWLVLWLDEPGAVHPQHPGYLPVARALRWLLRPLGMDVYAVLCVFSALGAALAVAAMHHASWLLRGDRTFARIAAVTTMFTPALFHFGTLVELHAPFAGIMALAVVSAIHWERSGAPGLAVCTGALTGAATLMHATGQLLVPAIGLSVWWAGRSRGFWRCLNLLLLFAVTHALVWGGVFLCMRMLGHLPGSVAGFVKVPDDPGASNNPLAYLARSFRDLQLTTQVPKTLLTEWLLTYAPVSVLAFLAFRVRTLRAFVIGFSAMLAIYVLMTATMVHAITDERGGYLLPMVVPAVWLSLAALPRRIWPLLAALAIGCGFVFRGEPGRLPPDRALGRAAVAMAKQHATTFFVADFPEMDGIFVIDAGLDLLVARKEYDELRAAQQTATFEPGPEQMVAWLRLLAAQQQQKHSRFVITDQAVQWLTARLPAFGKAWPMFVQQAGVVRLDPATGIAGFVVPEPR